MMQHGGDVITVLTTDHREIEVMLAELERLRGTDERDRRKDLTEQVIIELVRHSVAEEAYLYPAARKLIPGGDLLADRDIAEHAEAERLMKELERTDVGDPAFDPLLDRFTATVREHVREEESRLFPQLVQYADVEELVSLGRKIQTMKKVAPTRPHPSAPVTPPVNKLLAPGTGLVDRIRDAVTGRGRD
ncbi:hemerythrin domain-containing protein [Sphaerisporangium sp. TRM90804]|uniref:hemerythrin domain-containing protein n=1 Tax=Sphaerisporangium sp. TRM90804 TaxID=3031113 RepID=UPI002447C013|nr:hemerythrin domain-containing protein [Sphaerisporangium sp. TRM90804]MDH2429634.1 hemerythrin domain-containing protein [Sphaerisporangium sp. TRM90804]